MIKGGFRVVYLEYDEVTEKVITSNADIKLFNWITNKFTYKQTEVTLTSSDYKHVSQPKFSKFIKKLVEIKYLMRVSRGVYRLNPFMYLPYKSNGHELQQEWSTLSNQK